MLDFLKRKKPTEPVTPANPLVIDCSTRDDINLGDFAREKVTGFEGIVAIISYEMDGTVLLALQPRDLVDGKPAEMHEFDIERIEMVEAAVARTHNSEDARQSVRLGGIYKDTVTGFNGTAVRRIDFLGGCTRVVLSGKVDKDNKLSDPLSVPVERLELIDDKPAEVAEQRKTRTGGPGANERAIMARLTTR